MFNKYCKIVIDCTCLITKERVRVERETFGLNNAKGIVNDYKARQKPNILSNITIVNAYDKVIYSDSYTSRKVA